MANKLEGQKLMTRINSSNNKHDEAVMKAVRHRLKKLDQNSADLKSRMETVCSEYDSITSALADEVNQFEVDVGSLIPSKVIARNLRLFSELAGKTIIRSNTDSGYFLPIVCILLIYIYLSHTLLHL